MSTLEEIMNMDQSMPYDKSARGRVVFASSPETYTNANGETKQSKSVAIHLIATSGHLRQLELHAP